MSQEWRNGAEPGEIQGSQDQQVEVPFWGWEDLFVFLAMAVPSLLVAGLATRLGFLALGWHRTGEAAQVLTAQFLTYLLWFGALYGWLKVKYGRPFWKSLGWVGLRRDFGKRLSTGMMLAAGIALGGAILRTPDVDMPMKRLLSDPASIALVGVAAVTIGPLCEEIAFRGFLMPLLVKSFGPWNGIVLSALPFALLHGPQYGWSWRHVVLIAAAGVAFGWTRYRSGSTAAAAVVHASYNGTFFLAYLLFARGWDAQW